MTLRVSVSLSLTGNFGKFENFISRIGEFKHMPKEQRKAAKKAKKLAKKGYKW